MVRGSFDRTEMCLNLPNENLMVKTANFLAVREVRVTMETNL